CNTPLMPQGEKIRMEVTFAVGGDSAAVIKDTRAGQMLAVIEVASIPEGGDLFPVDFPQPAAEKPIHRCLLAQENNTR
ncbi:hypothetical protein GBF38_015984, partial [Nibea albiflora]